MSTHRYPAVQHFFGPRRAGRLRAPGWLALTLLVAGGAAAWWYWHPLTGDDSVSKLLTRPVERGTFTHDVTEKGELKSSENVEIRCEVESRSSGGAKITQIVSEGTVVQPGDFLVRFDDANLRNELAQQIIAVNSVTATLEKARNDLAAAISAKREYEEGTYLQEVAKLESELFVAQENLHRAEEFLRYTNKLVARGYASPGESKSSEFDVEKNKRDVTVAETKLRVMRDFTREKTLKKHDADINTAQAQVDAEQAKLGVEKQKQERLEDQLRKCQVKAPAAGQVVYDHDRDYWGGSENAIKEGTSVHERRVIMRLPNPQRMEVEVNVPEAKIDLVKVGMNATVHVEGLQRAEMSGSVTKVAEYPSTNRWFDSSNKTYTVTVKIDKPVEGLRAGMTAEVAIRVQTLSDVLQVPVQAVVQQESIYYCLVCPPQGPVQPREVKIGSTNDKFLIIESGLQVGEEVLLHPRPTLERLGLATKEKPAPKGPPEVPKPESAAGAATSSPRPL